MGLPKQIQRQQAEAEEIVKRMAAEAQQVAPEDTSAENGETHDEPTEVAQADTQSPRPAGEGSVDSGVDPGPDSSHVAAGDLDDDSLLSQSADEELQQRYRSLRGVIQSEKNRAAQLQGRVESLESMLAQMNAMREQAQKDEAAEEPPRSASSLTPEEVDLYGEDLINVIRRAARSEFESELSKMAAENQQLREKVGSVTKRQEETDYDAMLNALDSSLPQWRELNGDQEFNAWLDSPDVFSGLPRRKLFDQAAGKHDAGRVKVFFQKYLDEKQAVTPQKPQAVPSRGNGKVKLSSLAAPGGSSGSSSTGGQNEVPWMKESEIGAFYDDSRKGKYRGRDDEYRARERQIQAAMSAGRILLGQ